jgi:hypothetical protein
MAIVWLEGLGQLKKIHLIGNSTRDLPACSIVPQLTTLPLAPGEISLFRNIGNYTPGWCNGTNL